MQRVVAVVTLAVVAAVLPVLGSDIKGPRAATALPDDFVDKPVATGLDLPTTFAFLPDGAVLIAEKSGIVRVLRDGTLLNEPFIDISPLVNDHSERGLLGMAVDPDFDSNGYVYLLYTYENDPLDPEGPKTSRLSRFVAHGEAAEISSETVILGSLTGAGCDAYPVGADCLPADGTSHSAGSVRFADDGTLFVSNGDAANFLTVNAHALRAQDLDSLAGKLLHIDRDGHGLPSNPFYDGDVGSARSKVWAYGIRNAFRFNLRDGELPYVADVGSLYWEEINAAIAGANLGWPCYEGDAPHPKYATTQVCIDLYEDGEEAIVDPVAQYERSSGAAIVGGVFYEGSSYPHEYRDKYFFGDYIRSTLSFLGVDDGEVLDSPAASFAIDADGPVEIGSGPGGDLYYLSLNTGQLHRVRYVPEPLPVFEPRSDLAAGLNPHSVRTADLNGDGALDVIAGSASSHSAALMFGLGDGDFDAPVHLASAGRVKYALPADLNGDDVADLVTANESTDNVTVRLGAGDGSFGAPSDFSTCNAPHEVMAEDLDGDDDVDLVVPCTSGDLVSVLFNTGGGAFASPVNHVAAASPHSVAIEDLDEDGHYDLAVATRGADGIAVLFGDGTGAFADAEHFATSDGPHEVRAADLNADGHVDLATANDASDSVSILLGDGTGDLAPATNYDAGNDPMSLAAVDLDEDGIKDLAVANSGGYPSPVASTSIGVFIGNGDGTFEPMVTVPTGPHPFSIAAADLDSDGYEDLLTANFNVGGYISVHLSIPPTVGAGDGGAGGGGGGGAGPLPAPGSTDAPSPSPTPSTHFRAIDLHLRRVADRLIGRGHVEVDEAGIVCRIEVPVNLRRNGETVARTQTDADGAFRVRLPRRRGSYRASSPPIVLGDGLHRCLAARSLPRRRGPA